MVTFSKAAVAQQPEAPIHGDILEAILSHVPLIDLVPASHVSKSWSRAVSSSLRAVNRPAPWLILHTQGSRPPYATAAHAYDPRSRLWIEISHPSIKHVSALRSSSSNILYMLSPYRLSFSTDPLRLTWREVSAPLMWRIDPIVALFGRQIVVAGGTCDFEDDPLAVEIYDMDSSTWTVGDSMPAALKDSAASTWLSIAASESTLYVTEKQSGVMHTFDPETKKWHGPYALRPDNRILYSVLGFSGDRLILIGVIGDVDNVETLKVWEVDSEKFECEEVGEMPGVLVEKLSSEDVPLSSIGVSMAEDFVYIYNPAEAEELFVCEFVGGGGCRWRNVENVVARDRNLTERLAFTCSKVGIEELQRAMRSEGRRFTVKVDR
ncbi:hypothetical protein RJ640_016112 [Escallonia rubra]|uniref:F-box domain-containing protein n=1 Tax=Escallonia rubra TaxID=112253 RepID=A0AA88R3M9_9ASTE|nr:hypothetical protein RJ640_016112 [Escallonia rubra]